MNWEYSQALLHLKHTRYPIAAGLAARAYYQFRYEWRWSPTAWLARPLGLARCALAWRSVAARRADQVVPLPEPPAAPGDVN